MVEEKITSLALDWQYIVFWKKKKIKVIKINIYKNSNNLNYGGKKMCSCIIVNIQWYEKCLNLRTQPINHRNMKFDKASMKKDRNFFSDCHYYSASIKIVAKTTAWPYTSLTREGRGKQVNPCSKSVKLSRKVAREKTSEVSVW
jgi:hypothetical protein